MEVFVKKSNLLQKCRYYRWVCSNFSLFWKMNYFYVILIDLSLFILNMFK